MLGQYRKVILCGCRSVAEIVITLRSGRKISVCLICLVRVKANKIAMTEAAPGFSPEVVARDLINQMPDYPRVGGGEE
ncbi:MAG: hypothetical protein COV31_02485 [Candidatus Yanofskybacteria bacterium CG10_big_fil_rev_8_21_14_0_10_46_23]|uniref:Uncharacterized protein n=1 Tax=Candidatus Yanofskybacteria bacterium CG10_big_fil_rev_8_21_14_0_10_46_23 TaxID=1975098 RepID=A0A2H0R3Z1_9BACT|nr:MAG: hypothetical protein COV31_02485 [Candidatus Yanofskybacteria bacterium CG10_big_fil_rev_8_21_14_0_10_46_23]